MRIGDGFSGRIGFGGGSNHGIAHAMNVASSGMSAERFRMDVTAANIANANTAGVDGNGPYRRRGVVLQGTEDGVKVAGIQEDYNTKFLKRHDPSSPFADKNGDVETSNVQPITEMVDMISATRFYEANVAAFNSARGMMKSALNIGKI